MSTEHFKYTRPDLDQVKLIYKNLTEKFKNAESAEEQIDIFKEINLLRSDYNTHNALASINYTKDTTKPENVEEYKFFNINNPEIDTYENNFIKVFINSKFRDRLESEFGKHLFNLYEVRIKTQDQTTEKDMQEENLLVSKYVSLTASAKIPFENQTLNLSGLAKYKSAANRETRIKAHNAFYDFFNEKENELNDIYDQLVKTRHKIAKKLGYEDYIKLSYDKMSRTDYDHKDVAEFRKYVKKYFVPLANKLYKKQAQILGLEKLNFYDEPLLFKSGNAKPKGDMNWIIENSRRMYSELSPETDDFFEFMLENKLMDLETRQGKAGGGYCTFLANTKMPFIFANFNGTKYDIKVLTHEVGHAFQSYMSRNYEYIEYVFPTMESAEIHSMSMELITWPWMELFFKDEAKKFCYHQMDSAIKFIPYACAVDEFQELIFQNPDATPDERKKIWQKMEKEYLSHREYAGIEFLENGGFWQQQAHIYKRPFYYIDYALAQICALQFWVKTNENKNNAWDDYIALCKEGGSKPFTELLEVAGLKSPFEEESLKVASQYADKWLSGINVKKLES